MSVLTSIHVSAFFFRKSYSYWKRKLLIQKSIFKLGLSVYSRVAFRNQPFSQKFNKLLISYWLFAAARNFTRVPRHCSICICILALQSWVWETQIGWVLFLGSYSIWMVLIPPLSTFWPNQQSFCFQEWKLCALLCFRWQSPLATLWLEHCCIFMWAGVLCPAFVCFSMLAQGKVVCCVFSWLWSLQ